MNCLIAVSGSINSEAALRFVNRIASSLSRPISMLTVVKRERDRQAAEQALAAACQRLIPSIPEVRRLVRVGHPADQIIREAREGTYDVLIVGQRHDRPAATRFLLRSTGVEVAERAPCPVFLVKGSYGLGKAAADSTERITRMLLCDSNISSPNLLSRFTAQLAKLLDGDEDITVLHVMSQITAWPGVPDDQLSASAEELIQERTPEGEMLAYDLNLLNAPGIQARARVRHGRVIDQILDEATNGNYDLVVIGAHRDQGWQRLLLDNIAHQIITHIDRPILVVR